jgi:hypothetical protein
MMGVSSFLALLGVEWSLWTLFITVPVWFGSWAVAVPILVGDVDPESDDPVMDVIVAMAARDPKPQPPGATERPENGCG